jgi:hypothetical protein
VACTFAGASVTHECALKTREPICVTRAAKPFFIPMVHNPSGAVGHVAAPELPSQEVRTRSRETRSSTVAHLSKEVRPGAVRHVVVSELTSARR